MPDDGLALGHGETRVSGVRGTVQVVARYKRHVVRGLIGHSALETKGSRRVLTKHRTQCGATATM